MKENSREEDIKIIENLKEAINSGLCYFGSVTMYDCGYQEALEHILSDYKRVLKENEELKQEKINNYKMMALAQNEALGYMQGYEDGKNSRTSAIASIVENQQYYIIREQIEKYEEHIKRLQKENKELKNQEVTQRKINELLVQRYSNSISLQKVKDKIENLQNEKEEYYSQYKIDELNDKIQVLQELLEGRE